MIHKKGCRKCSTNVSKMEREWLDNFKNKDIIRQFVLKLEGKSYSLDGYEFYGDFWHGNLNIYNIDDFNPVSKKKFGELWKKTIDRENYFKSLGYNVISIWENEFKK